MSMHTYTVYKIHVYVNHICIYVYTCIYIYIINHEQKASRILKAPRPQAP